MEYIGVEIVLHLNSNQVTYKLVIFKAEFLVLSAGLYFHTSDSKYSDAFKKIYKWLKDIQFTTSNFNIIDGIYKDRLNSLVI